MDVCCECFQVEVSDHSSREVLPTVARRCVWSRNLEHEEAKAHYRVVKNTTTMECNVRKTNKKRVLFVEPKLLFAAASFFVSFIPLTPLYYWALECVDCVIESYLTTLPITKFV
jgi:hypothetical protein